MKDLKLLFEKNGCVDVQTYIQSGNGAFRATAAPGRLATQLTAAISRTHQFEPLVLVLTKDEVEGTAAQNPYRDPDTDPRSVHIFFLAERPKKPDLKALEALKASTERFTLKGKAFYLHAPEGIGRSKLAARVERLLGVAATARNWRTVTTLLDMA